MPMLPSDLSQVDTRVFLFVYGALSGGLTSLALLLSAIGSGWVMFGLAPLLLMRRWRSMALSLAAVLVTSGGAVFALKHTVSRIRPCYALPDVHALCAAPTDPSFPSGHACGSFTLAAFLVVTMDGVMGDVSPRLRMALRVLAIGAAVAIAWSRVYLGVHFPTDVAAGALLGALVGGVGGWLHLRREARDTRDGVRTQDESSSTLA